MSNERKRKEKRKSIRKNNTPGPGSSLRRTGDGPPSGPQTREERRGRIGHSTARPASTRGRH